MESQIIILVIASLFFWGAITFIFTLAKLKSKDKKIVLLMEELHTSRKEAVKLKNTIDNQAVQIQYVDNLQKEIQALNNSREKLEKENIKLKENLDDIEFDVKDLKKKLKKNNNDFQYLRIENDDLKRAEEKIKRELNDKEEALNRIQKQLHIKQEAIKVTNELLSADPAHNQEKSNNSDKNISDIQEFILNKVLITLSKYNEISDEELEQHKIGVWQWSNTERKKQKKWFKENKTVAFVGEFSAGKTSIINKILSHDMPDAPQLLVSSKATTAIPTYVSYNEAEYTRFSSPDGILKRIKQETFRSIKKELLEEVKISSLIQYFVVLYKNLHLKGLSILDTPGFNSNDKEDAERTSEVIKETDVLFWVLDANSGELNNSSIKIIKEHLTDHPIYIIINKTDTKSAIELEELEKHIDKTLKNANIPIKGIVKFSNKHDISELMEIIRNIPHNSPKQDYLKIIIEKLQEKVKEAKDDYLKYQHKHHNKKKEVEDIKHTIGRLADDIKLNSCSANRIPEKVSSWFKKDKYVMDRQDYEELTKKLELIEQYADRFKKNAENIEVEVSEMIKKNEELNNAKEQFNGLDALYEGFRECIKKWNKEYEKIHCKNI